MSDSSPSPSKKRFLLILGLLLGGLLGYTVVAHWSDVKAGFRDGYNATAIKR